MLDVVSRENFFSQGKRAAAIGVELERYCQGNLGIGQRFGQMLLCERSEADLLFPGVGQERSRVTPKRDWRRGGERDGKVLRCNVYADARQVLRERDGR